MHAPGLFYYLVRDGAVPLAALTPLLERLPPEQYVATPVRDGEAFDSTRWPLARDAALASLIARRFSEPAIDQALAEIEAAAGDRQRLRAHARRASARLFAGASADPSIFLKLWSDATPADLADFVGPPWPAPAAAIVAELCTAHYAAADGLYAYHLHRNLPGTSAEPAAQLARRALDDRRIDARQLVDAALALVVGEPDSADPLASAPSGAAGPLVDAITDACAQVRRITGATGCHVLGERYAIPSLPDHVDFMIAAGARALVVLSFADVPTWTSRISSFRSRPLFTRMGAAARFDLVLSEPGREQDRPPAAVASLCFFVELTLEAHLASHPADEAVFPILDDATLERIFG